MIYLGEFTYYDLTTFQTVILRVSSGPAYMTLPSDTPPNTYYMARMKVPFDFECNVFQDGMTGGMGSGGFGAVQLVNNDGFFDKLIGMPFDGRQARILYGDENGPYSGFAPILTGTQCQPDCTWKYFNIPVRDYTELFNKPISQISYLGNNIAGNGIEGTPSDLMGKSKPVTIGHCLNVTPAWASQGGLIYQVHGYGQIKAVDAVYSNGAIMPLDYSVNGTVEAATATYASAYSLTFTGVNKTGVYTPGLMLYVSQAAGAGNLTVVSSVFSGGNTTVTLAIPSLQSLSSIFALTNAAITKIAYGGGDCTTLAALQAATPAAGCFITCLAMGLFKISGGAGTTITADVRGAAPGGVYANTIADCCALIAQNYTQWPRTNQALYSEDLTNAAWVKNGLAVGGAAPTPPVPGMGTNLLTLTGSGVHNLTQTLATPTGLVLFAPYVIPDGWTTFRLKLVDHANSANYCSADFDLVAGTVTNIIAAGLAVGPNYSATGFITAAGMSTTPSGAFRPWIAGQPNSTLTSVDFVLAAISSGSETFSGSGAFYSGGEQIEFGFASPHIYTGPTTTGPVTGYDPIIGATVNTASFAALKAAIPYDVGYYVGPGETTTAIDVMNALCASGRAMLSTDRNGALFASQFNRPSQTATPLATFNTSQIIEDTEDRSPALQNKDDTPAYRVSLSCMCNWTPLQPASIASSLWTTNTTWVQWLGKQWRQAMAEDRSMLGTHPLGCVIEGTSYIADMADALAEANLRLVLYKNQLNRFTLTSKIDQCPLTVMSGSLVEIIGPRFNMAAGQNFVVVSIGEKREEGKITLGVLG